MVKLGHGPTWRTTRFEHVHSWSPDDRLVLTIDGVEDGGYGYHQPVAQRLRVRDARTGRLVATFDGIFEIDFVLRRTPHWESDRTLVLVAYDRWGWDVDDGPVPEGRDRIRCNVTTASCRTVPGTNPLPGRDGIVVRRD